MKAISLTQPWATLVAIGAKRIETRSWATSYRGPLAIHASMGYPRWARETCEEPAFARALGHLDPAGLLRGYILATAVLVDCVSTDHAISGRFEGRPGCLLLSPRAEYTVGPDEYEFGDYSEGRWAWILEDVKPLSGPVRARGFQQLWNWEAAAA